MKLDYLQDKYNRDMYEWGDRYKRLYFYYIIEKKHMMN